MGLDTAGRQQTAQGQHQSLSEHWSKCDHMSMPG
jgi:hypothetical protein